MLKGNIMKKIALLSVFTLACFGAPDPTTSLIQTPKDSPLGNEGKKDFGFFFGGGIGGGMQEVKRDKTFITLGTIRALAKLGAYHELHPLFGLRYYYGLDLGFLKGTAKLGSHFIEQVHTLNLDLILRAYSGKYGAFDLIFGAGWGASIYNLYYFSANGIADGPFWQSMHDTAFILELQSRINVGMRWMSDSNYGLELMAKIPFIPEDKFIQPRFDLTLDFVMKL